MARRKESQEELARLIARELYRQAKPRNAGNPFPFSALETGIGKALDFLENAVAARVAAVLTWLDKRRER